MTRLFFRIAASSLLFFVAPLAFAGAGDVVGKCANPCPSGSACVEREVHCVTAPCPPIASCEPIAASPAPAKDENPCAKEKCPAGTKCRMEVAPCKRAPCPEFARCTSN